MSEKPFQVTLQTWPTEADWLEVKRRTLVTVGKTPVTPPDTAWKHRILEARHSPIRWLRFSFDIECPYFLSVHLCRHVHAQPYVRSQRNDRQSEYDRNAARQDAPVSMVYDINSEELMVISNKRLCSAAAPETRAVVTEMCRQVEEKCPEFRGLLVPLCEYCGGVCHEMFPCGKYRTERPLPMADHEILALGQSDRPLGFLYTEEDYQSGNPVPKPLGWAMFAGTTEDRRSVRFYCKGRTMQMPLASNGIAWALYRDRPDEG